MKKRSSKPRANLEVEGLRVRTNMGNDLLEKESDLHAGIFVVAFGKLLY